MFVRLLLVTVLAYICFFNLNPDHCYAFGKKHGNDGGIILSRKKSGEVKPDDEIDESRISIGIDDSIGDILRSEDKLGKSSKKFHIKSKSKKGQDIVEFDAVEATPAVTPETIISYVDGEDELVGETGYSLLVADPSSEDGTFAIVSVNTETNEVQGFLQKKNLKAMKISQHNGQASFVEEDDEFTPPAWTCRVSEKTKNRSNESLFERALQTNTDHRHQLEYGHYHHDENMEDHAPYDPEANFEEIRKSLRGSKINFGDRRKLQSGGESYSYQVNMFIQVDQSFVNKSGGQAGAIQYVNTLITAANTVYEQEIDTHLHVAVFSVTSLYDSYNDVDPALDKMVATYKSGTSWQSAGIDLQHAFIGRSIGGGLAYVGVICDTSWGYGISSGLSGGFVDINSEVVWDLSVIMHEIGHQFGSDHTHDSDGYSPVVDTCGTSCPPGLPLDDSTTLMSYCDFCDGGYSNLLYTFGGEYSGSGSRSSLSNWKNNPSLQGNISNNPKRVPYTMWSHVSSRGSCVQVTNQTPSPTPSPTQLPTAKPTIASPTQKPTTHAPTNVSATAVHDAQLGAPKCSSVGSVCDTGTLVNGRAGLSGGQEPNGSNTIDTCNDGSSGSYHSDESIDRVVVKTADGSDFKAGSLVTIDATVYAYDDGSSDYADFYYTSDANNPVWSHIGTKQPTGGGIQILSSQYVVPSGGSVTQAVRVVFKYVDSNSATVACPGGAYDDVDDVVFTLSMGGVPTKNPTSPPTSLPTMAPSQKPTSIPTLVPTPALTQKPTATPPTQKPSNKPTIPPTKNPTNTSGNTASYDSQFGAPKCSSVGSVCDTGTLVNGRAGLSGGQEPNGSNTIDTCNDGSSGSYHSDESIDRVVVKTADGSDFKAGSLVTIDATVYAYDDGSSDYADFYYTSDANNPVWSHIGTKQPTGGGIQILSSQYVVPSGGSVTQAVRVVFKYVDSNSATVACPGGAYDDVDDVVFTLSMGGVPTKIPTNTPTLPPTMAPTQNPTSKPTTSPTNLPTHSGGTQPLISLFDSQLDIPSCKSIGISCDSGELLVGRSSVGPEPNLPNSLDTCMDGNRGTFHVDESVDRVLVKTKDGSPLARGKFVTIEATVFAYGDGSNDFADFYYTTDAFNPSWVFIGTKTPPGGGSRTLSADYTVPTGGAPMQAVRVNFRYGGSRGASTTCVNGNYNDVDDLAFQVA